MSVIDVVDLATGQEIVLMIVTMDTEDLVEGQGHQEGEGIKANSILTKLGSFIFRNLRLRNFKGQS